MIDTAGVQAGNASDHCGTGMGHSAATGIKKLSLSAIFPALIFRILVTLSKQNMAWESFTARIPYLKSTSTCTISWAPGMIPSGRKLFNQH